MQAPGLRRSHKPWRIAAVGCLVLAAGGVLATAPDWLEANSHRALLAVPFALLWMMPVVLDQRDLRRIKAEAQPIRSDGDPRRGNMALDIGIGLSVGLVLGALYLLIPGSAGWLGQGPQVVDWLFGAASGWGVAAVVAAALGAVIIVRFALMGIMAGVRANRIFAAMIVGLYLWVPFHQTFSDALDVIGIALPGLFPATGVSP